MLNAMTGIKGEIIVGVVGVALTLLASVGATGVVVAIDPLTAILIVMLILRDARHETGQRQAVQKDTQKRNTPANPSGGAGPMSGV